MTTAVVRSVQRASVCVAMAAVLVGCSHAGSQSPKSTESALVAADRFDSLFLTDADFNGLLGVPLAGGSTYSGTRSDQSSDDDVSKACSMMNTALASEPVYGKDYLRYQLNEPQSPPDQVQRYDGQVDYAIVLYPQEENAKAAFQRLAVGFHMCQLSDGKHGWFTLGEDSASKLTWTTNEANGVDHLCAFDSRIARNVFITARVCGAKKPSPVDVSKIAGAVEAKVNA